MKINDAIQRAIHLSKIGVRMPQPRSAAQADARSVVLREKAIKETKQRGRKSNESDGDIGKEEGRKS